MKNYELSYEELLERPRHQGCLTSPMTEVYKFLHGISPDIMNDALAVLKRQYNTRPYNLFVTDRPKTERYGQNSIPYRVNQILILVPREMKKSANLDSFKLKIKQ